MSSEAKRTADIERSAMLESRLYALEVSLLKHSVCLREITRGMEQLADSRPDDWDVKGYALALRGLWMEMIEP